MQNNCINTEEEKRQRTGNDYEISKINYDNQENLEMRKSMTDIVNNNYKQ